MRAITIWQPWAWAIAHAGKDIENRTWKPPQSIVGRRIAIHAGKRIDTDVIEDMQLGGYYDESLVCEDCPCASDMVTGAFVATAVLAGTVDQGESPWFRGPIGWLLRDVKALPQPVPCRGAQGLWTVPDHIVAQLIGEGSV